MCHHCRGVHIHGWSKTKHVIVGLWARLHLNVSRGFLDDAANSTVESNGGVPVTVGYYNLPLLKAPHWKWQVPLYFFFSGLASTAFLFSTIADWFGDDDDAPVVAAGRYLALAGVLASLPLLIDDLGRPERFVHMLRVFKMRSPMSVGAWALTFFGGFAGLAATMQARADGIPGASMLPVPTGRAVRNVVGFAGAPFAVLVAGYTGVLLAATSIPLWGRMRSYLAPIFFLSGSSSALSAITIAILSMGKGRRSTTNKLRDLEVLIITGELVVESLALRHAGEFARPLIARPWGQLFWIGSIGIGQIVPLVIHTRHLFGFRRHSRVLDVVAALATLAGGFSTRLVWVNAGKTSAADPAAAFAYHQ